MSESEDSDESRKSRERVEVKRKKAKELKFKPNVKKFKPNVKQFKPNVKQFKPHFIPGSAFDRNKKLVKTQSFVRKRNHCLAKTAEPLASQSTDGNDSDQTVFAETTDDWRNGPAKYWYDLVNVPEDCVHYDYGLKLREKCRSSESVPTHTHNDSEDAFHLVSQIYWEKDVIWDSDVVRQKIMKSAEKPSIAGWIPIEEKRTAPEFVRQVVKRNDMKTINTNNENKNSDNCLINVCNSSKQLKTNDKNKSKTNCEKKTTINGVSHNLRKRKENNKSCDKRVEENSIQCLPNEPIESQTQWVSSLPEENRELVLNRWEDEIIWDTEAMDRIPEPKVIPLSGDDDNVIIELNECLDENSNDSTQMREGLAQMARNFNISNDEFYASVIKADNSATNSHHIIHSIPAVRLHYQCFPTCVSDFNRPLLKRSNTISRVKHNVSICGKHLKPNDRLESDGQNTRDLTQYIIKTISDLTARNGDILLMEYCEEDPPLVMRVGMGSKIINYFKKPKGKACSPVKHRYGETKIVSNSPFIGDMGADKSQLALETNMFRSPIFEHSIPETDFLIVRTNDSYYIRDIDGLFVVGQELPLMEVPRPKSKTHYDFIKQFAKLFIYRFFDGRKSVKDLEIATQKAFPNLTKHLITSTLRRYTRREGERFLLKSDIPFDNQINNLLTPEDCCAYYSTSIASHKLRERGYGDRLYLVSDGPDCDNQLDELSIAPWNTSVSYIGSINARKWLNVSEYNTDGTLTFTNQSYRDFRERMPTIKRCQPVSDLSLKRMTLKRAHEWLINYGMTRNKVKKLKNVFECNFLIKELSEKLRQNGVTERTTKTSTTEQHYRYECQKIFDLHSSYYSSTDRQNYSTDEEEDEEEEEECDSDLEDMGKDLEAMIVQNKTLEQIQYEREEEERKEFIDALKGIKAPKDKSEEKKRSFKGMILKIERKYQMNGKIETRTEIVRRREVIEAYVRIRETKSEDFIRQLSFVRNHTESGRQTTKSKAKTKTQQTNNTVPKEVSIKVNGISKNISENVSSVQSVCNNNTINDFQNIDINEEVWDITESNATEETEELVRVDGSKLKFSKKVVNDANEIEAEEQKRLKEEEEWERKRSTVEYFVPRSSQRCRIDPMVKLKDIFDALVVSARKLPQIYESIDFFMESVKKKDCPDYYDIITNPIDLKTIRLRVAQGRYSTRQEFLKDIELIYKNSLEYNGSEDQITIDAQTLVKHCTDSLAQRDAELNRLEQMLSNDFYYKNTAKLVSQK